MASHCSYSPSICAGVEIAVVYIVAGTGVDITVADIVSGTGVAIAVTDIAADEVAITVPTLFNLADIPCCNTRKALGSR